RGDVALVLLEVGGEAGVARLDGDEVQPVAGRRVDRGAHRGLTGVVDRGGRQAHAFVRVVRTVDLGVGRRGAQRGAVEGVVDGGVHLERHAALQPVEDHPGHLAHVGRVVRLGLDDAGDGDRLVDFYRV